MHFVDDINLIARTGSAVMHAVDNFANIVHTGAAGGIHFHHVNVPAFHDRSAVFTFPAGFGCRPAAAIFTDTVHAFGNDPRGGGFAGAANAGHDKGLGNAVGFKGVF